MTHRSSEQHTPPKSTTISRRPRNRAGQNLAVQPLKYPRSRVLRTRRAATLPRHNIIDCQTPEPPASSLLSEPRDFLENTSGIFVAHLARTDTVQPDEFLVRQQAQLLNSASPSSTSDSQANSEFAPAQNYSFQLLDESRSLLSLLPSVTGSHDFELPHSADVEQPHDPFVEWKDMSTLGFMMAPSQYGMNHYGSTPTSYSPSYPPQHSYAEQRLSAPGPYSSSYASSPSLTDNGHSRRQEAHTVLPPYQAQQSLPRSPYQQGQAQENSRGGSAPLASSNHSYTYSATPSSLPSQPLGSNVYPPCVPKGMEDDDRLTYKRPQLYPPTTYGVSDYHPLPTMYPPSSTTPAAYPSYDSPPSIPPPHANPVPALSSSPATQNSAMMPRILNSRPKPTCWDHGCNGRQFSTFSNLLRHQREKSGTASKSFCPKCGAEFTRTTARNGHMAHDKCKARRASESDR